VNSTSIITSRRAFVEGLRHHNAHEFYEAHESWEELWIDEADDDVRRFLQGLIQVTSAFHKLVHQRMPGSASRLLARGLSKLEGFPDHHLGVELGRFRAGALALVPVLAALKDPEHFDRTRIPTLHLSHPAPEPA
jgi:predicted metal-dependent hydrolase